MTEEEKEACFDKVDALQLRMQNIMREWEDVLQELETLPLHQLVRIAAERVQLDMKECHYKTVTSLQMLTPGLMPAPQPPPPPAYSELMTQPEVAEHFGVSQCTVSGWAREGCPRIYLGKVQEVKRGALVRYHLPDVERWLEKRNRAKYGSRYDR